MFHAVYIKNHKLQLNMMEYLKKHQIVYKAPEMKGYMGFPIGNGQFGGMLYHTADSMQMTLAHTDAIDYCADGTFKAWAWESEDENTAPVASGVISITNEMPAFDPVYLTDYKGVLRINDGTASIHSKTPFCEWNMDVFCSHSKEMLCIKAESQTNEPVKKIVSLKRWGSRNFFHQYEQMSMDKSKNLGNMEIGTDGDLFYVMQQVRGSLVVTLGTITGKDVSLVRKSSHQIDGILSEDTNEFCVLLRCLVLNNKDEFAKELKSFESDVKEVSYELLLKEQYREWKEFWEKSFVSISKDDYAENLYYMYLYLLNSCSRGKKPIVFGSIWAPNRDMRQWGHFYHWNNQQTYWGLLSGGHTELAENYYSYRFDMLKNAEDDAEHLYGTRGAYYSDISNLNGYQAIEPDTVRNFTAGCQIAMDFYRCYLYTMDDVFLKEKAYPMMKAAAQFYEDMMEKDGKYYHVKGGSTCYESYWNMKETMTDRCMLKAVLQSLIKVSEYLNADEEKRNLWKELSEGLYPVLTYEEDGKTLFAPARKWDGKIVKYGEGDYPYNTFGCCQLCGVYPADLIGLWNKDTEDFKIAKNTIDMLIEKDFYKKGLQYSSGHNPAPQMLARLGIKEHAMPVIRSFIEKYQWFHNGTFECADMEFAYKEYYKTHRLSKGINTDWHKIHEKEIGDRVLLEMDQFMHLYFEPQANIYAGINEILLQSNEGVIRVFPAAEKGMEAVFSLYAQGGYKVTSEIREDTVKYIQIESQAGGECKVCIPWNETTRVLENDKAIDFEQTGEIIVFQTKKDCVYMVENCQYPVDCYYINEFEYSENEEPKYFEGKCIGREQNY